MGSPGALLGFMVLCWALMGSPGVWHSRTYSSVAVASWALLGLSWALLVLCWAPMCSSGTLLGITVHILVLRRKRTNCYGNFNGPRCQPELTEIDQNVHWGAVCYLFAMIGTFGGPR